MKRGLLQFGSIMLLAVAGSFSSGCTQGKDADPYEAARYKTKKQVLRTQPWSTQEKWEQGGMMGNYLDPRYQH